MQRVLTAAVLLAILLATIKLAPPFAFSAVALLFIAVATWESYRIIELDGGRPLKGLGLAAGLAITWSFLGLRPHFGPEVPIVWLGILATTVSMWRRPDPRQMLRTAGSTLFPVVIVGLGLGFLVGLRSMPDDDGEDLLMLLFSCVILADTAAFYVGTV